MRKRKGPSSETRSIYGPRTSRIPMPRVHLYRKGERPPSLRTTSAYPIPQSTVEEPHPDAPTEVEPFEGTKPLNLTLIVAPEDQRDKFSALEHKHTYREIRPNRAPGQRGAYQVEMTYPEYQRALEDTRDPDVNLIAVEPEVFLYPHSIPGTSVETYMDMTCQGDLGLDGKGIDVGIIEYGYGPILTNYFAGRVKAKQGFGSGDPDAADSHGAEMVSLAVPPAARVVAAAYDGIDTSMAAALYWMVDEVGVHVINISQGSTLPSTLERDAVAHASQKNVPIFASRGNSGTDEVEYPAGFPGAYAIANYVPSTDARDSESSFGGVFAAAAGVEMNYMQPNGTTESYDDLGGSSEAAAMTTFTAASLLSGGASFGNLIPTMEKGARKTGAGSQYEGAGVLQLCTSMSLNTPPASPDGKGSAIGPGSTSETDSGAGGSGDLGSIGTMPGDDPSTPECLALLTYLDTFSSDGPQNPDTCTGNPVAVELAEYLNTNFGIDLEAEFPFEWSEARNGTPQEVTVSVCGVDIVFTLDRCAGDLADPHDVDIALDGPMSLTRTGYSPNSSGVTTIRNETFVWQDGSHHSFASPFTEGMSPPLNQDMDMSDGAVGYLDPDSRDSGEVVIEQVDPQTTLTLTDVRITYIDSAEAIANPYISDSAPGFYVAFTGEWYADRYWMGWHYVDQRFRSDPEPYKRVVLAGWPIGIGVLQRSVDQSTEGDVWRYVGSLTGWQFADYAGVRISGGQYYFTTGATLAECEDPGLQYVGTIIGGYFLLPDQANHTTRIAFYLWAPPEGPYEPRPAEYTPVRGSYYRGTALTGYRAWEDKYCAPLPEPSACDPTRSPNHFYSVRSLELQSQVNNSTLPEWQNKRHDGLDEGWYYERGPWLEFNPGGTVTGYTTVITDASFTPSEPDFEPPQLAPGLDLDNPPTMDMPFPDFPFPGFPCVSVADVGINMCLEDMTMPELPMPCFPDFPFGDCPPSPGTGSGIGDFGPGGEIPDDGLGNGIGTGITAGKETFAEDKCFPAGTSLSDAIDELSDMLELDADQMTIDGTCDDTLENEKCFPKGSSIWDAVWWLSDQCGMLPIDGGDTVTISPTTPLDTTWILNEYTNLFDFTPVLDNSELFWGVEVFRADISKGGTIIVPGLEVLVQVPTPFAADPNEIFRVSVDPGVTELEATRTAKGIARRLGRISFRVTATTFFNPNLRLRHRIRIVRPSKDFDMEFMCTSITHDLSETGKFSTVEAHVILPEPELVPA